MPGHGASPMQQGRGCCAPGIAHQPWSMEGSRSGTLKGSSSPPASLRLSHACLSHGQRAHARLCTSEPGLPPHLTAAPAVRAACCRASSCGTCGPTAARCRSGSSWVAVRASTLPHAIMTGLHVGVALLLSSSVGQGVHLLTPLTYLLTGSPPLKPLVCSNWNWFPPPESACPSRQHPSLSALVLGASTVSNGPFSCCGRSACCMWARQALLLACQCAAAAGPRSCTDECTQSWACNHPGLATVPAQAPCAVLVVRKGHAA